MLGKFFSHLPNRLCWRLGSLWCCLGLGLLAGPLSAWALPAPSDLTKLMQEQETNLRQDQAKEALHQEAQLLAGMKNLQLHLLPLPQKLEAIKKSQSQLQIDLQKSPPWPQLEAQQAQDLELLAEAQSQNEALAKAKTTQGQEVQRLAQVAQHLDQAQKHQQMALKALQKKSAPQSQPALQGSVQELEKALALLQDHKKQNQQQDQSSSDQQQQNQQEQAQDKQPQSSDQPQAQGQPKPEQHQENQATRSKNQTGQPEQPQTSQQATKAQEALKELARLKAEAKAKLQERERQLGRLALPPHAPVDKDW